MRATFFFFCGVFAIAGLYAGLETVPSGIIFHQTERGCVEDQPLWVDASNFRLLRLVFDTAALHKLPHAP